MGRPREKRKYTKKSDYWNEQGKSDDVVPSVVPADVLKAEPKRLNPEMLIEVKEEEEPKEVKIEHSTIKQPKKQHEMFHNLVEGQMDLETEQMRKRQIAEIAEREKQQKAKEVANSEPFLECPFCHNTQKQTNSKEPTSAWCVRCGKAFGISWKYK